MVTDPNETWMYRTQVKWVSKYVTVPGPAPTAVAAVGTSIRWIRATTWYRPDYYDLLDKQMKQQQQLPLPLPKIKMLRRKRRRKERKKQKKKNKYYKEKKADPKQLEEKPDKKEKVAPDKETKSPGKSRRNNKKEMLLESFPMPGKKEEISKYCEIFAIWATCRINSMSDLSLSL